jgi:DNA replication protein DnaC
MSTKNITSRIEEFLRELHMPTIRRMYTEYSDRAQSEQMGYMEYLHDLIEQECEERRINRIHRFVRESGLPAEKTLETFDMNRIPVKVSRTIKALIDGSFLKRNENVLAFGNPGSGKTHVLCALGYELIQKQYRVYFSTCSLLVEEMLRAKQEMRLDRFLKKLSNYHAVIIDDIGYVQHNREEMEVLFTLLSYRYERGSVMLTSNLPFSQWEKIFKDPMTTAAAIDRLVHHSVILELNVKSYRMESAKNRQKINGGKQ